MCIIHVAKFAERKMQLAKCVLKGKIMDKGQTVEYGSILQKNYHTTTLSTIACWDYRNPMKSLIGCICAI